MHVVRWTTTANGTGAAVAGGAWPTVVPGAAIIRAKDTGPRPPGRPRDAALDSAILRAAARQLAERGYAGMSMEGVAAAAGTTAPSLRRRFRDKLDLTMAAINAMRPVPLPPSSGDPRADTLAILESLRVHLARRSGMAIVGTLLAEERRNPELLDRFRKRIDEPAAERLRQALAEGVQLGHLQPDLDLDIAASLLLGSLYACYLGRRQVPDDWAERALGVIWPPAAPGE
ncbi:MAG TPA: TetR/AcrR family transcriptional regulator C-terminal ligand-binding domain-containing protein [Streptosporangiaceae bacterium]